MRLHELSKALFVTTRAAKPRFLFGSGYSCSQFVRKPDHSNSEFLGNRGFTVFFWCTEQISLIFTISDVSIFEQPSRANCVRQPRFDTCLQIITSKKHLDIFYSNLKKYLTSRLYNLTSRLLQKHLNLDENNLKWQL